MLLVLILSFTLYLCFEFTLKELLQPWSFALQDFCISQWQDGNWAAIGGALVCGHDISNIELKTLFLKLGLYHLLVVSGAHLIFLAELLRRLGGRDRPNILIAITLTGFGLMTGFGAPLVRSGVELGLRHLTPSLNAKEGLFLSLLGALCLHPPWIHSLSLALSFSAGLALKLSKTTWSQGIWISALCLPLVLSFGTTNALGLIVGFTLSSVFESLLFPLCLLAIWSSTLQIWLEPGLNAFVQILHEVASLCPDGWRIGLRIPTESLWLYMALIYALSPFPTPNIQPTSELKSLR